MSNGDPMDERETQAQSWKKPLYQRKDFWAIVIATPIGLGIYAFGGWLGNHVTAIWECPENVVRVEHRIMLVEKALKIIDPVPFTADMTNTVLLSNLGLTNKTVVIDP